jgi:ABC-type phosphate/phosphonate transport system substrate-binding protein
MTRIAALPMYDWPEERDRVDRRWASLRDRLRAAGIAAPDGLVRRNGDMPAIPGGIRAPDGRVVAPDPASLPPEALDLDVLWRHPALLVAETCWGPMAHGLAADVTVVGPSHYASVEGGRGTHYSSVIIARRSVGRAVAPPADGRAILPVPQLHGGVLAYNDAHSLSGFIALRDDLHEAGVGLDLFSDRLETGAHRASIRAVAEGRADIAAIDCRSWALAQTHEPAAADVHPVGWTSRRPGLPFITATRVSPRIAQVLRQVLGASLPPVREPDSARIVPAESLF